MDGRLPTGVCARDSQIFSWWVAYDPKVLFYLNFRIDFVSAPKTCWCSSDRRLSTVTATAAQYVYVYIVSLGCRLASFRFLFTYILFSLHTTGRFRTKPYCINRQHLVKIEWSARIHMLDPIVRWNTNHRDNRLRTIYWYTGFLLL